MEDKKRFEFEKIKEVISNSVKRDIESEETADVKIYTILFMGLVCLLLTVMNIMKHYAVMGIATGVMAAGLLVAVYMFKKARHIQFANWMVVIIIALAFSFFAISGRNEGFAILWIMLVPAVAANILNLKMSLMLSSYFQLLLLVMFYTPLRTHFLAYYTETFCVRFPVLYFATFIVSYIIVIEKEFFSMQLDKMAHTDVLTGLANRREYDEVLDKIDSDWDNIKDIRVFSMDLNGLKQANDNIGHNAGDELIRGAADCIASAFPNALVVSRTGGDEFALVTDRPEEEIDAQMSHLSDNIRMWRGKLVQRMSIASGSASKAEHPGLNIYELGNLADQAMYDEKRRYYETSGQDRRRKGTLTNIYGNGNNTNSANNAKTE